MWFKREQKNRRLNRRHVLDVKLRSEQVRATRMRLATAAFGVLFATVFGLYLLWRTGEWALDRLVYENTEFAVQNIEVRTDGVIAPDQLRRWSGVKYGANLFALDLADVKRKLELVSVISSVSVERVLPRTLKIRVSERDAVAQVNVPRADEANCIAVAVFRLDADGVVIQPLDPRLCTVPLSQMNNQLPVITGLNVYQLQPGRRLELPQVQAALQLVAAFNRSPMAGLVDLQRIDVAAPQALVVTTMQGSEITFGLENLEQQLRRWRGIYDLGQRANKNIASADLAVANNVPVRWTANSVVPGGPAKSKNPSPSRRKNV
jgi:cell division septal protein FtsQ